MVCLFCGDCFDGVFHNEMCKLGKLRDRMREGD